jgi:hypothetical protein
MAGAIAVALPAGEAQAGGRLEGARAAVRPSSSSGASQGMSRPPSITRAPVRVHVRSVPPPAPGVGTRVTTTVVVRHTSPQAVPPPVPLGPEAGPVNLQGPPPRPLFQRHVHRFPYEAGKEGWVVSPWTSSVRERHRRVAGRLEAEGAYLYKGLWRSGVAARVGTPRVDVDSQLSFYLDVPNRDALYLGDTSLNLAPVAEPRVVWRVGLGARYMLDARLPGPGPREYAMGWNVNTSIDAFPVRPFVISARLDRGTLYHTPVWRARATVGIVRERFELYAGYEHTQIERVALGGPALGLRLWL